MIVKAIEHKWLAKLESETMGYNHLAPKDLLTHQQNIGGTLNHMDITELISNLQKPWDAIKKHQLPIFQEEIDMSVSC